MRKALQGIAALRREETTSLPTAKIQQVPPGMNQAGPIMI